MAPLRRLLLKAAKRSLFLSAVAAVLVTAAGLAPALAEIIAGPIPARVEKVIDGDTLRVRAHIWLGQEVSVLVRIRGIDTPEIKGRCAEERSGARAARSALETAVADGNVVLSHIEADKYGGRVLADVATDAIPALGRHMIADGLARDYAGRKRGGWC